MKIKNLIKLYFTLIIIFSVNVIFSQQTYYFFTPQNTNDQVIDFFNKKQFSILKQQTKIIPDKSYPTEAEYAYYKAYSAYMLHKDVYKRQLQFPSKFYQKK